jgi:hypothetical protein
MFFITRKKRVVDFISPRNTLVKELLMNLLAYVYVEVYSVSMLHRTSTTHVTVKLLYKTV